VLPEDFAGKGRKRLDGVTNEASCGMGVKAEQEWNEEMMGIPEGLKGLLTDLVVSGRVHEEHAKEHDVACDASNFCIMNLKSGHLSNLCSLNIEEAALVSTNVI
jgi:hypothetical protein